MRLKNMMLKKPSLFLCLVITILIISCKQTKEVEITQNDIKEIPGMVWIPGGTYDMGASDGDLMALPHEKPKHPVKVDGFYMDATESPMRSFLSLYRLLTTSLQQSAL